MRLLRSIAIIVPCTLGVLLLLPCAAAAQERFEGLCTVLLDQARIELEDLEVAVQVHQEESLLAEEIFEMADPLWHDDLLATVARLGAQHRRDTARIVLEIAHRMVDRQRAVLDQHELACSDSSTQEDPDDRGTIEQARQRYLDADCAVLELEVALSGMNLEYQDEAMTRSQDLLQNDIVNRRQVLFTERDVNVARHRLRLARQRAARCQR